MRKYDLNVVPLIAAVNWHRNFRRAAAELGMSASNLSERIREFERQIGLRLLNRITRSVSVTAAGEDLPEKLSHAVADIDSAVATAVGKTGALVGSLRINGPQPAVEYRLMPLLLPFMAIHPTLEVEVVVESALVDVIGEGFDAGIRYGEAIAKDMIAISLGAPQRLVAVASPAYLLREGYPTAPEDLKRHNCFRQLFPNMNALPWSFEKGLNKLEFVPSGSLRSNNVGVQINAALAGLGVAYVFEDHVLSHLARRTLEMILSDWSPAFPGPLLYYPERRLMPTALRAFVDYIKTHRVM